MPSEQILQPREEFLKKFVKFLIENSLTPEQKEEIKQNELKRIEKLQQIQTEIEPKMVPSIMHENYQPEVEQFPVNLPSYATPKLKPGQQPESISLGKITQFLVDPSVISVECPGPKKNVLVNRSGKIQTSSLILSEQEINSILNEASDKTRIPLNTGLFKAAFQDLLITAVISEFVGTRFIIQKRTPFQKY